MHTEIPLSLGMEFPLEVFVLWIIRRPVRYDEDRLEETERENNKTSNVSVFVRLYKTPNPKSRISESRFCWVHVGLWYVCVAGIAEEPTVVVRNSIYAIWVTVNILCACFVLVFVVSNASIRLKNFRLCGQFELVNPSLSSVTSFCCLWLRVTVVHSNGQCIWNLLMVKQG